MTDSKSTPQNKALALWRKLTTPKSKGLEEARLEYSTRVLTVVIFGAIFFISIISIFLGGAGLIKLSFVSKASLGLSVGLLVCIYLNVRNQWRIIRFVVPILTLAISLYSLLDSGMNTGGTFAFIFTVLLAQLLLDRNITRIFTGSLTLTTPPREEVTISYNTFDRGTDFYLEWGAIRPRCRESTCDYHYGDRPCLDVSQFPCLSIPPHLRRIENQSDGIIKRGKCTHESRGATQIKTPGLGSA